MIVLENVSKSFGEGKGGSVHAVNGVSLRVGKGDVFGIIGFSGAGKSTLVRLMNMLEKPDSGRVVFNGQELTGLPEERLRAARRGMGMIFQLFNLMRSRTVEQNVAFPLMGTGMTRAQRDARAAELLALVGLTDKAKAYPAQLSGGQKQRVAIARALASRPGVLLCDEATSALDPQTTADILGLLQDLNRTLGITIVLITHEMAVVKGICTKVAVMDRGRVVEEGSLYDVFSSPRQEVTRRFIDTTMNVRKVEDILEREPAVLGVAPGDVVARLDFKEDSTRKAVISSLSRQFGVDASIVFGNVETVAGRPLGTLVVSFRGAAEDVERAYAFLRESDVRVEELRRA
ncbi:MAG TPA: ATP-binding cassette domain-containing protein [Candidatus Limnocylindria bacterium]|nr:ATP-binding cassette domain-containing protein [Candidatus Limnocylindria bacterium]